MRYSKGVASGLSMSTTELGSSNGLVSPPSASALALLSTDESDLLDTP